MKIKDLGKCVTGRTPLSKNQIFYGGEIPFIRIPDLGDGRFIGNVEKTLTIKGLEAVQNAALPKGSVMVSCIATIGKVGITSERVSVTNQQINSIIPNTEIVNAEWLYYFFKDLGEDLAVHGGGGSVFEIISKSKFQDIEVELPDLPTQEAIAEVLSSLDDKIDLLKRQNKTLEDMAETLFRQWFIEEAQDDWEEVEMGDLALVVCGKTPDKRNPQYFHGPIPFIKIPDMHGRAFVSATKDSLSLLGSESQRKKLLPPHSILVSCIATVGLVTMNIFPAHTNQQINALIPRKPEYRYFLYCFCKSIYKQLQLLAGGGTATLNLNTRDFGRIHVKMPANIRVSEFHTVAENWFHKMELNHNGIRLLEAYREVLLPKLMGSEIRIASPNKSDTK